MKWLSIVFVSFSSLSSWALSLQNMELSIPSIRYEQLRQLGLDDRQELADKESLKELLKNTELAAQLLDPQQTDTRTHALVQEIRSGIEAKQLRLYKNKARKIVYDYVEKHWDLLSQSTVNEFSDESFKAFSPVLLRGLNENFHLVRASRTDLVFQMDWARVRVLPGQNLAQIIIQQDHLGDENQLIPKANAIRSAEIPGRKKKSSMTQDEEDALKLFR